MFSSLLLTILIQLSFSFYTNIVLDPASHMILAPGQQSQMTAYDGQYYTFSMESQFPYATFNTFSQSYPNEFQFQDFQYLVVIDFEATCDKDKNPHPQKIIEFPSSKGIKKKKKKKIIEFPSVIVSSLLSDFCKDLTGIQQIQVDRGVTLSEALLTHGKWLENKGIKNTNFAVVTWSNWDCQVMLESDWINLKVPFRKVFGVARCNLKKAVEMADLSWQGRAHCGLDGARNTAQLLSVLVLRGFDFSVTNSLMWQAIDPPMTTWTPSPELPSFSLHQPYMLNDTTRAVSTLLFLQGQEQRRDGPKTRSQERKLILRLWELDCHSRCSLPILGMGLSLSILQCFYV
ncbi:hypothetical protein UlMin_026900 [Ulmus minor]